MIINSVFNTVHLSVAETLGLCIHCLVSQFDSAINVAEVRSLLEEAGILLIFLPPYSPDFNPIEMAFGYVKGYLKQHDDIAAAFPNPTSLVKSAFDDISIEHCQAWITHSKLFWQLTFFVQCTQSTTSTTPLYKYILHEFGQNNQIK